MNKNRIEINIELSRGQMAKLILSPRNYKQNYRDFKEKYKISEDEAINIKKIIQSMLIELAKNRQKQQFVTPIKQQYYQEEQHRDSPRFPKYVNDQESQTIEVFQNTSLKQTNRTVSEKQMSQNNDRTIQKIQKKKKKQQVFPKQYHSQNDRILEKQFTMNFLSNHASEDDREPMPKSPPKKFQTRQQHKEYTLPTGIPYHQEKSYGNKVQKCQVKTNKTNKNETIKSLPKKIKIDRDTIKMDRLYYQQTDSFKSKKNEEVDPKQLQDYIEVQKFDLNNRLKRTTKEFFHQLSKRTTQSWDSKTGKSIEKHYSQQETLAQLQMTPSKKVSLEKAYKGSNWHSRSRCEAQLYIKKIQKERAEMITKDENIRKRMKKAKLETNSEQKLKQKSRSCQKCNPKNVDKWSNKVKVKKEVKKNVSKDKKKYISNILRQAFQQRCEQMRKIIHL